MRSYRVYFRIGFNLYWRVVEARNALVAKQMVERSYWVLRTDRTEVWNGSATRVCI